MQKYVKLNGVIEICASVQGALSSNLDQMIGAGKVWQQLKDLPTIEIPDESDIRFYIPKDETIPTNLLLYVGDVFVRYERIHGGFRFHIDIKDETKAMEIAEKIVQKMEFEHDESQHGVSWRTLSLEIVPQDERYKIDTIIDWKYRVRDSY